MAEKMFAHQIKERGLSDAVRVTSAGTGGWHAGDPADNCALDTTLCFSWSGKCG